MIVNYEYLNGKLILSYIDEKGNTKFKNYQQNNPLQQKTCSDTDLSKSNKYTTWDKKPVKLEATRYPNRYSIYEYLKKLPEEEKKDIFAYNEPKMFFCDIEVEITDGFPEAHLANNVVTAICIIFNNKVLLYGVKDIPSDQVNKMESDMNKHFEKFEKNYKIQQQYFETEYDMLSVFFNDIIKKIPVLTGQNFVGYDQVYLVTRARKLNINPNVASPTGQLIKPYKKPSVTKKPTFEELPIHRLVFDYMDIFDKQDTSIKIKENNTLDFVASKVLGVKKLEYECSLKELYTKDYYKYLLYNCVDTALVQLIHEKQKTFDLMLAISNLANIPIENSLSAIRVTEGIFFNKYFDNGIVMAKQKENNSLFNLSSNSDNDDLDDELDGGYVKYPTTGLISQLTVFDFSSLYPTTMRQFNIAPESYLGLKLNEKETLLNGIKNIINDTDIVLLNDTVFKNENSQTKQILTNIFNDRKKNKNIGLDFKNQKELLKQYYNKRFN